MNLLTVFTAVEGEYDAPELDDVRAVTEDVWASLVSEEPLLPRLVAAATPFEAARAWSAAVTVSGAWQGTVTVELDAAVAGDLTALMLGLGPDQAVTDTDVADAVGELVNMIGGNLKSLMPGPSALSLPMVAAGRSAFSAEVREAARLDLSWHGAPLRVCVHVPSTTVPAALSEET